jgi:hypothetical protein
LDQIFKLLSIDHPLNLRLHNPVMDNHNLLSVMGLFLWDSDPYIHVDYKLQCSLSSVDLHFLVSLFPMPRQGYSLFTPSFNSDFVGKAFTNKHQPTDRFALSRSQVESPTTSSIVIIIKKVHPSFADERLTIRVIDSFTESAFITVIAPITTVVVTATTAITVAAIVAVIVTE